MLGGLTSKTFTGGLFYVKIGYSRTEKQKYNKKMHRSRPWFYFVNGCTMIQTVNDEK
jgi:hypothetical protein